MLEQLISGIRCENLSCKNSVWSGEHEGVIAASAGGFSHYLLCHCLPKYNAPFVDLGAGRFADGYKVAQEMQAQGYVGVEPNHAITLQKNLEKEAGKLPFVVVDEDMRSFLRRIPDNSVAVLSSGFGFLFAESEEYIADVEEEIRRVVSHPTQFINYLSCIKPFKSL